MVLNHFCSLCQISKRHTLSLHISSWRACVFLGCCFLQSSSQSSERASLRKCMSKSCQKRTSCCCRHRMFSLWIRETAVNISPSRSKATMDELSLLFWEHFLFHHTQSWISTWVQTSQMTTAAQVKTHEHNFCFPFKWMLEIKTLFYYNSPYNHFIYLLQKPLFWKICFLSQLQACENYYISRWTVYLSLLEPSHRHFGKSVEETCPS